MNTMLLGLVKALAPALISALKTLVNDTDNEIDNVAIDTIEFILKRIKIID